MTIGGHTPSASDRVWRPVIGSDNRFEVSDHGDIRIIATQKLVKLTSNDRGYLCCGVVQDGQRKIRKVHIMVAEAFLGHRPNALEVTFIDGVKANCQSSNLRYASAKESAQARLLRGPAASAKLTAETVLEMRKTIESGKRFADIAAQYDVSYGTVKKIKHRLTWSHI